MRIPHLLRFAAILVLCSCEFEPEGTVFTDVAPPITDDLAIEIPSSSNDTIYLFQPAKISYRSMVGTHELKFVRASVDGKELITSTRPTGSFDFYTPSYANGIHTLTIEVQARGASGSLADIMEKELLTVTREYKVSVDRAAPNKVAFTSVKLENGFVKTTWAKYQRKNFQSYTLYKYCHNPYSNQYESCVMKKFNDQTTTTFVDSSFIGGKVKYSVSVTAADQWSGNSEVEYNVPYDPQLKWEWKDLTHLKFTWTRPRCYGSFTSYTLSYGDTDNKTVFAIDNIADTTLVVESQIKVGQFERFMLVVNPHRTNTYSFQFKTSEAGVFRGTTFPAPYSAKLTYNIALGKYFALRETGYSSFELSSISGDNVLENKLSMTTNQFSISEDGKYFYTINGSILTRVDPLSFATLTTINISTLANTYGNWIFNVSNGNILAATNAGGTYIIDLNTAQLLQQLPSDYKTVISDDGKYLFRNKAIMALENGVYVSKMTVPAGDADFISDDRVLISLLGTLVVVDLQSFTVLNTILIEGAYRGYDPVSGLACSISTQYDIGPNRIFLYKLDQKVAVKEIEVSGSVILLNNALVSSSFITPLSPYYP